MAVYNNSTYQYDPITPVQFTLTNLSGPSLSVYSKVGSMEIPLTGCTTDTSSGYTLYNCPDPSGTNTVKMRQSATLKPTDTADIANITSNGLLCFRYCPDGAEVQAFSGNYYHYDSTYEAGYPLLFQQGFAPTAGVVNAITYTFDAATMLLQDVAAGQDVVFGPPPDNNYYRLDYGTGPLITNTAANLSALACDTDPSSTCADKADTLPVYYTWETGSSSSYHLALLKDLSAGGYFIFDEPTPMSYTHKGSGKYYGQTFMLTYYGFDNWLSGIPSMCVNPDTWEEMVTNDCYGDGGRNVYAFNVPFGGKLTFTHDDGSKDEYFSKALAKEQYMLKLGDTTPCASINVQSYPLPDPDTGWQDPLLGPMPVIDAPPAVVDGELQNENQ